MSRGKQARALAMRREWGDDRHTPERPDLYGTKAAFQDVIPTEKFDSVTPIASVPGSVSAYIVEKER